MIFEVGGESGGERAAVQTLCEIRGRPASAPAFGLRWLQHRSLMLKIDGLRFSEKPLSKTDANVLEWQ